jgi:hypothetical protein
MPKIDATLAVTLALVAILPFTLDAQGKKKGGGKKKAGDNPEAMQVVNLPPAKIAGEIPGDRVSDPNKQSDWPAMAYAADGSLYAVYVEWNDKDADRVIVRRRDPAGKWGPPVAIDDGNWDHYAPAIVARGNGALAVWSGQSNGNFDLFASEIPASGSPSKPERLTTAAFSDFNVRAAADKSGNVTVVWQSFRRGNGDIFARKLTGKKWGAETRVSTSDSDDWEPAIALDSRGMAWISWDSYHTGNYDVFLRSFDGAKLGEQIAITSEPDAQFHSSVAVDGEDRVWVAWDEGGINWGKDFSRASSAPGSRGLHYSRKIEMRVYANGRLQAPAADLSKILTGRMTRYAELPHLATDGSGALYMVFRHWTLSQPHEIYHFYVTRLSGDSWSEPYRFTQSSGQNTQHASMTLASDGKLAVGYSSDLRSPENLPKDQMHSLHYNVYVSSLPKGDGPPKVTLNAVTLPAPATRPPLRPRATMTAGGKTYHLLMGDAHRHTDIRGHSGVDGSVLDTYRYAMDAAQLDWLGTSDHNEVNGGRWPDGLRDYSWWCVQKTVDLMTHAPTFIGAYAYEHSMNRPAGHRNILFLKRGAPLRPIDRSKDEDNLPPNLWKWMEANVFTQAGQKSVIVPHTFGAGPLADWNWPNARFDCLLEIYQGCRGSYEAWRLPDKEKRGPTQVDEPGHFAQDALAKGNIYGYVSFSDHGSTHNSWACIWAEKEDRAGLLDGMYARHTYAGSDEIILKATADGHMVGDEFNAPAGKAPLIEATINSPDELLRIDIVKDGKYVYTTRPTGRSATLRWRDSDTKPGKSYYYVRVFERDTDAPDGDPEIAWGSPFYVTYQ